MHRDTGRACALALKGEAVQALTWGQAAVVWASSGLERRNQKAPPGSAGDSRQAAARLTSPARSSILPAKFSPEPASADFPPFQRGVAGVASGTSRRLQRTSGGTDAKKPGVEQFQWNVPSDCQPEAAAHHAPVTQRAEIQLRFNRVFLIFQPEHAPPKLTPKTAIGVSWRSSRRGIRRRPPALHSTCLPDGHSAPGVPCHMAASNSADLMTTYRSSRLTSTSNQESVISMVLPNVR